MEKEMKEIKVGNKIMDISNYRVGKVIRFNKTKRKCYVDFRDKYILGDRKDGKEWINKNKLIKVGDVA